MASPLFSKDLSAPWLLDTPNAYTEAIALLAGTQDRSCLILRDDLLHPWANGNKLRKLDGYLPALLSRGITDVLTCGGVQSAHCAALSCLGAERGLRVHVLLRGERPAHVTGNLAITMMYAASTTFVPRDEYADREQMFARAVSGMTLRDKALLEVIPEGGRDELAMAGYVRLIEALVQIMPEPQESWKLVIDAGTGVSTAGLVAGIVTHGVPWQVHSIMLVKGAREMYEQECAAMLDRLGTTHDTERVLTWVPRSPQRRFGQIKAGDIERCQQIARATGVMFDPVYTLASYEYVCQQDEAEDARTLILHTGGALNMFGALSRFPDALR